MKMSGSQGLGAFVRCKWAQQHADLLARYIAVLSLLPECGPCVALAVAFKLSF